MIVGLSTSAFTLVHVLLSLLGVASGLVVLLAMLQSRLPRGVTNLFLATTAATSATGFLFPFQKLGPPHYIALLSLGAIGIAVAALVRGLTGPWRAIYVVTAVLALYLNVFVGVVQAFEKIPQLHALAPTQSEPPFIVAQLVVLVVFASLGARAVARFRPTPPG